MKLSVSIFILFLVFSCNKKQVDLQQYVNYPVKFGKQKINNQDKGFSIYIPKNWLWKMEDVENDKNIIFNFYALSEPEKIKTINFLSILKFKSFENNKDIKSEYNYFLKLFKNKYGKNAIIESGNTNFFKQKAYFYYINYNNGINKGPNEIIFIMESKQPGEFYLLGASASKTKDYKMNMAILLQCLMTFEELNK